MQNKYAIIVAGGSGSRMGNSLPKQYQLLLGKPILMHTLAKFVQENDPVQIVLVLHAGMRDYWMELCKTHQFTIPHQLVNGGESRFQSVRNGLQQILADRPAGEALVAIHDAARPLLSASLITQSYSVAKTFGAAVVALPSSNSVRLGTQTTSKAVDRSQVWLVQTPQTFRLSLLEEAFKQAESPLFTDDASVVEQLGIKVHLIPGEQQNIKITFPEDLAIAALIMKAQGIQDIDSTP